jgi:hypothetical protein
MTTTTTNPKLPLHHRAGAFLLKEFHHILPPTVFFAAGFCLIVATQRLLLQEYLAELAGFMVAITSALVVGKAVLVADKMPFLRTFDNAPLIRPILFKTVVYWVFVFIARFLERVLHYALDTGQITGFFVDLDAHFSWHRFLFIQTWIFVLFLVYTSAAELNALLGDGELWKIFFTRRSDDLKRTRRQRVRSLVRLNAILRGADTATLRDPASPAHRAAMTALEGLARDAR